MYRKGSRKWFKRVGEARTRYIGDHTRPPEYAARGAPYLGRLRHDLEEWWGDHPDPGRRLTAGKLDAIARRRADYIDLYISPMTPPETYARILPEWLASAAHVPPDPHMSELSPMLPSSRGTSSAEDAEEDDIQERESQS